MHSKRSAIKYRDAEEKSGASSSIVLGKASNPLQSTTLSLQVFRINTSIQGIGTQRDSIKCLCILSGSDVGTLSSHDLTESHDYLTGRIYSRHLPIFLPLIVYRFKFQRSTRQPPWYPKPANVKFAFQICHYPAATFRISPDKWTLRGSWQDVELEAYGNTRRAL